MKENIKKVKKNKKNYRIHIDDLYDIFRDWYQDCLPGKRIIGKMVFSKHLRMRWGNSKKGYWSGIKFKGRYFSDEDGNEGRAI